MIKKTYTKTGSSCRVTFTVPPETKAQTVYLCGDFNQWDRTSHPMKHRKGGSFSLTLSFKPDQQYRFRYLLDGERWENDATADAQTPNPFGGMDSVAQVWILGGISLLFFYDVLRIPFPSQMIHQDSFGYEQGQRDALAQVALAGAATTEGAS